MNNLTNFTNNSTLLITKSSKATSAGELILVIFLSLVGTGIFGVVVYLAVKKTKNLSKLKSRAMKYLDNSSSNVNKSIDKKESIKIFNSNSKYKKQSISDIEINSNSNKRENENNYQIHRKNLSRKENNFKKLKKNEKDIEKISTDSQNSINANIKFIGKSQFIKDTNINKNSAKMNLFRLNIDKMNCFSSNDKINIFSNYNSFGKKYCNAIIKEKYENSLKNMNVNDNNIKRNCIKASIDLNLYDSSKIKVFKRLDNDLEDFKRFKNNLNNEINFNRIENDFNNCEVDKSNFNIINETIRSKNKIMNVNICLNQNKKNCNLSNLYNNKNPNFTYNNLKTIEKKCESDINEREINYKNSKYEFKNGLLKKNNYKMDVINSNNSYTKNCKKSPESIFVNEYNSSCLKLENLQNHNLINSKVPEKIHQGSRNMKHGLISNLNSSKFSDFIEKVLVDDEFSSKEIKNILNENVNNLAEGKVNQDLNEEDKINLNRENNFFENGKNYECNPNEKLNNFISSKFANKSVIMYEKNNVNEEWRNINSESSRRHLEFENHNKEV